MNTVHSIDKLSFTFFIDRNALDPLKVNMFNEVSSYLLPVIEEVFDNSSFNDYDLKIDKLTIDLGSIKVDNDSIKGGADRLKQMLEDELKKRIQNSHMFDCTVVPRKKNDEKLIVQYLLSGIFTKKYIGTPDYLLEEILRSDSMSLLTFLINNSFNDTVIRRLVWQFNIESIEKIIIALNPSDHEFIIKFLNTIKYNKPINKGDKKVITSDTSIYHRQILEFTLKYSLCERQVQFNRIDFVHTMLLEISNHYNIGITGYIDAIIDSLQCTSLDTAYKSELVAMLTKVQDKYVHSDADKIYTPSSSRLIADSEQYDKRNNNRMQKMRMFTQYATQFYHLLDSGTSKEQCAELWDLMIGESMTDTIDFLYHHCTTRRIIRNFVQLIVTEKINECIKMLAPDNLKFIHTIITTTDSFVKSATVKKQPVALETSRHKQYIYEFIIEYLIRQKNGVFSERAFTHGMLVEICNHHNIAYTSLIVIMLEFLINEANVCDESGFTQLVTILQKLFKENCKKNIPHRLTFNRKVSRQFEIVELYEHCRQFVFNETGEKVKKNYQQVDTFVKYLKTVYRNRPDLIYSLFQTMKNESACIRRCTLSYGVTVCKTLLLLFIETIVDRYRHIQWIQSRNETLAKIQKQLEKFILNGYTYDDMLTNCLSMDFLNVLNEDQFFQSIQAFIVNRSLTDCKKSPIDSINEIKKEHGNNSDLSNNNKRNAYEFKRCITQNDYILKDDSPDENYEITIKTFFSKLHTISILSNEEIVFYRKIVQTLIWQSPDRLRMWLKLSSSNNAVVENLSKIVTEKLFLQLLLFMGSHTALVMYHYYTFIVQSIYTSFPGNNFEQYISTLQKVILDLVFKLEVQLLNDDEIELKTGVAYLNAISEYNDKMLIKKIIGQEKKSSYYTVKEYTVVPSIANNLTEVSIARRKNELKMHVNNSADELQKREIIIGDLEKEEILVTSAGIIIGAAYFERLFAMLKLTENKKFVDEDAIQKAIKVLHYFATNRSRCCEYEVSLNKIICGAPIDFLPDPRVELSESDKEITDSLVDAIITNWPIMKNTKRESFRKSFLERKGYLSKIDGNWLLQVEKRAFDMLIDTLPWGFSMIKLPWMKDMMQVEWGKE